MPLKQDFLREAMTGLTVRSRILWLALGVAVLFHLLLAALVPSAQLHSPKLASAKPPIRFSLKSSSPPSEKDAVHRALQEPSVNSDASMAKMAAPATGVKEVLPHDPSQNFRVITPENTSPEPEGARGGSSVDPIDFSPGSLAQQISEVSRDIVQTRQKEMHRRRIVHFQDVKTGRAQASAYEAAWQEKVEHVGNLNFPEEARREKLSGSLVMAVGILSDGSVYSIQMIRSSGQAVLDEGAKRIIQLATPFAPLPEEVRGGLDVLVITRTWRFDSEYHFGSDSR